MKQPCQLLQTSERPPSQIANSIALRASTDVDRKWRCTGFPALEMFGERSANDLGTQRIMATLNPESLEAAGFVVYDLG